MTAQIRFPRFYVTNPAPCPYLPDRNERKVFTELKGPQAEQLNEALSQIGFRRSQAVAYRPSCLNCQACVSVRVVTDQFKPSTSQRRNLRRNADLVVNQCQPWATEEQFELLQRYLVHRHPEGGMALMDEMDFSEMVEQTPVSSSIVEYREPAKPNDTGRLVGVCLTDLQSDGYSMVYSFFDAEHTGRTGLGDFIILDHIRRAAEKDMQYVYLGYWIKGSRSMQYKMRYRPIEWLTQRGWEGVSEPERRKLVS